MVRTTAYFHGQPEEFPGQCEARCGKKVNPDGTPRRCRLRKMNGLWVCQKHGGKSLKGTASPSFVHGMYSTKMPKHLVDAFHQAMDDPDLLSLRADLAVSHVRVAELIGRLETGEHADLWKQLRKTHKELHALLKDDSPDLPSIIPLSERLGAIIEKGVEVEKTWELLAEAIERKANIAQKEHKRLVDMQQMMTKEAAAMIFAAYGDVVRRNVTDRTILAKIAVEWDKLIGPARPVITMEGVKSDEGQPARGNDPPTQSG